MLAGLVSFVNPSMIVIGGGLAELGHILLAEIRSVVYRRSLPLATGNLPVVLSELGPAGRRRRRGRARQRGRLRAGRHDTSGPTVIVLRLTDVVKTFPGVRALDGVELEVRAGEVHCLLGQNGAGKSTLIKVLSGVHRPDAGQVEWLGEPVAFANPQAAMKAGIATIYQELDLVDDLIGRGERLPRPRAAHGSASSGAGSMARRTREILGRLGHARDPGRAAMVRALPAAGKQIVSMARALSHDARLIIMDEPSAVLAHDEVANLFRIIRELTAQGIAVIYISHRLEEIREIGDRVTVLKDGRTTAANLPARTTPTRDLVSRMTGRTIEYVFPDRARRPSRPATELLRVDGLEPRRRVRRRLADRPQWRDRRHRRPGRLRPLRAAGDHLRRAPADAGTVPCRRQAAAPGQRRRRRAGRARAWPRRSARARRCCSTSRSTATSRWPPSPRFATAGLHRRRRRSGPRPTRVADALELRPRDVRRAGAHAVRRQPAEGGGRPLAARRHPAAAARRADPGRRRRRPGRALPGDPRPRRAAASGVLLVSSEVPEVLGLADRVLVMREGRVIREAPAGELDEDTVLDLVMAGSLMEGAPA